MKCVYCYQERMRDADNLGDPNYDTTVMKMALTKAGGSFSLFGGEPLLTPLPVLETLWKFGLEKYGQNGVQTSGTLIGEEHLELFKKYKVHVGISIDGPGELNDARQTRNERDTREATDHAERMLCRLLREGHPCSVITTLHRLNVSDGPILKLCNWFRELDKLGLNHVNLHLLQADSSDVRSELMLTSRENADALIELAVLQTSLKHLRFQPITDMVTLLLGLPQPTTCTWNACDPYTTRAVQGVTGQGELVNCGRTNKYGIDMLKADDELMIRPLALYELPLTEGGCRGCRFFYACKGHCPGEAIDGDWRNKTEHCETLRAVFGALEMRLSGLGFRPLSLNHETVERRIVDALRKGRIISPHDAISNKGKCQGQGHGDRAHGDQGHGDRGHGDHVDTEKPVFTHGDHTDA
jgi:uncharacterized protein